jgi:amino acid transporter
VAISEQAEPQQQPRLQRNAVGLVRVIAFTAAFIGPAASIVLGLVVAVSFAGRATPFIVLLSFIAALLACNSVAEFAKRLPSAGSFYTYNAAGLGPPVGFVSGWLLAFGYVMFVPAGIGATGTFFSSFFKDAFNVSINENIFVVLVMLIIAFLAYEGIRTSALVDLIVLIIEMAVIVAVAITILAKGGPGPLGFAAFNPANSLHGKLSDLTLAMVFTVVIFTGFEAGAVLGEESTNPRRNVPRGIFGAVTVVGVFYLFVSYAEMHGVSAKQMPGFAANPNQLSFLTAQYWSKSVLWLIDLVVALSTLAFTISTFNAGARLLFAMGREGVLPQAFGKVSSRRTPYVSIIGMTVLALAIGLPVSITSGGFLTFAYLGGIAGLALILSYITVNISLIVAFTHRYRSEFNVIRHMVFPLLATGLFLIPLVGTFYPTPAYPFDILPYITIGWLVLGIAIAAWLARARPEKLGKIGRLFIED